MRRRAVLSGAALVVPAQLLSGAPEAAAAGSTGVAVAERRRLVAEFRVARSLFEDGKHVQVVGAAPLLLHLAQVVADAGAPSGCVLASMVCNLVADVLVKVGDYAGARWAADAATDYAGRSRSVVARAGAARMLSVVLRHQDQEEAARQLMVGVVSRVEGTGLRTVEQCAVYAQILASAAYTAAQVGRRDEGVELSAEAARVARRLGGVSVGLGHAAPVSEAGIRLYEVGVHWALGDAGAALRVGRGLHPGQFSTAERRGRMKTDLGRAWLLAEKPEQAVAEFLGACRYAPEEVRNRASIRQAVLDMGRRWPRVSGMRELLAVVQGPRRT
ncbi:transcriptional regulator [Streptomyces noursei]